MEIYKYLSILALVLTLTTAQVPPFYQFSYIPECTQHFLVDAQKNFAVCANQSSVELLQWDTSVNNFMPSKQIISSKATKIQMISDLDIFVLVQNNTMILYHRQTSNDDYTVTMSIENCYDFDALNTFENLQVFVVSTLNSTVLTYVNLGSFDSSFFPPVDCAYCNVHLAGSGDWLMTFDQSYVRFYFRQQSWSLNSTLSVSGEKISINSYNQHEIYIAASSQVSNTTHVYKYYTYTGITQFFNQLNIAYTQLDPMDPPDLYSIYAPADQIAFSKDANYLGLITYGDGAMLGNIGYTILRRGTSNYTFIQNSEKWLSLVTMQSDQYFRAVSLSFQTLQDDSLIFSLILNNGVKIHSDFNGVLPNALDCSSISHTVFQVQRFQCICQQTYEWNWGSQICESIINCASDALSTGVFLQNKCQCNAGAKWNDTLLKCVEINCVLEPFSTGTMADNQCQCIPGYQWKIDLLECGILNCLGKDFSTGNLLEDICECNEGYEWQEATKNCIESSIPDPQPEIDPQCEADVGSTGKILPNSQCQCRIYHYWDLITLKCLPTCNRQLAASADAVDPTKCICRSPAVWNDDIRDCYLDCSLISFSSGQQQWEEVCECVTHTNWNSKELSCDLNCSDVKGSTGVNLNQNECQCFSGHTWDLDNIICRRNCEEDPLWDQTFNPDGACGCVSGAIWNYQLEKCLALDCGLVSFATGRSADNQSCLCEELFAWNATSRLCILQCQDIVDPLGTGQNLNQYSCSCVQQSSWNSLQNICYRSCLLIENSTGVNIDATTCECKLGFQWSDADGVCITSCGSKVGQTGGYNQAQQRCECDSAFRWSYIENACERNCQLEPNTILIQSQDLNECICKAAFTWNPITTNCEMNCNGEFDIGYNTSSATCTCEAKAYFVTYLNKCMMNCGLDNLSTGFLASTRDKCICKLNAQWNPSINQCQCSLGFQISPSNTCVEPSGATVPLIVAGGSIISGVLAALGTRLYERRKKEKKDSNEKEVQIENGGELESGKQIGNADQM